MALRMITDKVFAQSDTYFTDAQIDTLKSAGFNVLCNRNGAGDPTQAEDLAERCKAKGVNYAPWMRWTVATADTTEQFRLSTGERDTIASPLSDTLWNHINIYLDTYAEMASRVSSVWGIFCDLEPYNIHYKSSVTSDNYCYAYSYRDAEIEAFCTYAGITCPDPIPDDRGAWLDGENEHDNYKTWQENQYLERFQTLASTVSGYTDQFTVVIYAAGNNPFIRACLTRFNEAMMPQPVMIAAEYNVVWSRTLMEDMQHVFDSVETECAIWSARNARIVCGVLPGYDYRLPYAMAQAARAGSSASDGYWVWFENTTDALNRSQAYLDALATISHDHHWSDDIITKW